jgi:signal transduction histidine kinase
MAHRVTDDALAAAALRRAEEAELRLAVEVAERQRSEERSLRKAAVVSAIAQIFREALVCDTEEDLGRICLTIVEEVTQSAFGSHDLRNPLAPIRNALYLLERLDSGSDQAQRARAIAGRQVAHLTRLVDDLLDMTRIARGKIELRRARHDLAAIVRRTGEDHRGLMADRGLGFEVGFEPFAQGRQSLARTEGGLGLGLAPP